MTHPGWFYGEPSDNFERLLRDDGRSPRSCLQIGVFTGSASEWLLRTFPEAHLFDVDTWTGSEEHGDMGIDFTEIEAEYDERMAPFYPRVTKIKQPSSEYLRGASEDTFDFVYIDGDHHAAAVLEDAVLAFGRLQSGGVMAFDDYLWGDPAKPTHRPKPAIDAFLDCYADLIAVIEMSYQVWVEKL